MTSVNFHSHTIHASKSYSIFKTKNVSHKKVIIPLHSGNENTNGGVSNVYILNDDVTYTFFSKRGIFSESIGNVVAYM